MTVDVVVPEGTVSRSRLKEGAAKHSSALVMGFAVMIAGTLSWLIVRPGDSLLPSLLADVAIFLVVGIAHKGLRRLKNSRAGRPGGSYLIAVVCVVCMLWTYFGVLAASVTFDSAAVAAARHDIAIGASGCRLVQHGSVGFISAPYQMCTTLGAGSAIVEFTSNPNGAGYAYISGASGNSWFADGCARHLIANWWVYTPLVGAGCPLGYGVQGV